MLYGELFYTYMENCYMVIYVVSVYGKLLVHIKGIIADEAETVPTGNMK
jgi:hypothetical protein